MVGRRSFAALGSASLVMLGASHAHAVSKQECATAFEQGQIQMRAGKLTAARKELTICTQPSCPEVLVEPCVEWLTSVERDLPTIVIAIRDEAGRDVFDAHVTIDGAEAAERLDGHAIEMDPGSHVVRITRPGSVAIEERVAANVGEKNRLLSLVLRSTPKPKPDDGPSRPLPIIPIALAGAGVLALGSFVFFGSSAKSDEDELRDKCAPQCTERDADVVDRKNTIAIVSVAASALLIGAAAYIFFAKPFDPPTAKASMMGAPVWRF